MLIMKSVGPEIKMYIIKVMQESMHIIDRYFIPLSIPEYVEII
ncbi:hypothetical protein HALA3H3_160008 [Halomonas sp. A3H3]|nr:hypothetical protein HALA3H3_160008 [Halomonas sp. A3H3]